MDNKDLQNALTAMIESRKSYCGRRLKKFDFF